MKIAIHGLGKMGMQIAHKLSSDGHEVIAHNRSPEPIEQATAFGAKPAQTKQDVLAAFGDDTPLIWLMLPAEVTDSELNAWLEVLPKGSTVIDGGNTNFIKTREHAAQAASSSVHFIDIGTSGGVWGMERGFCMMVGGDEKGYETLRPVLDTLAAPTGIHNHFGPPGAGHYVKMVHNAVEYGMMQSLAEGYRMLHEGSYKDIDLAKAGDTWQHSSVITSWLNELTRDTLKANPDLEGIDGYVAENGEARWTLEDAKDKGIELPAIQAALDVRLASQQGTVDFSTKLLAAMRNRFGGHNLNK